MALPSDMTWLPEFMLALLVGCGIAPVAVAVVGPLWAAPIVVAGASWFYIWMQTGHANALPWGRPGFNPNRKNTLTPVVHKLCSWLNIELYSVNYARLFMSVKGFLMGLPLGGLPLAVLFPLGYELGHRYDADRHDLKELAAGAGIGIALLLFRGLANEIIP